MKCGTKPWILFPFFGFNSSFLFFLILFFFFGEISFGPKISEMLQCGEERKREKERKTTENRCQRAEKPKKSRTETKNPVQKEQYP